MIVAIHQPNFLPWLGYFYKMLKADRFIFLDSVPFTKGGYTNRTRIKTETGARWLTLPVQTKGKLGQLIKDVECCDKAEVLERLTGVLYACYDPCPFSFPSIPRIAVIVHDAGDKLVDVNIRLVEFVAEQLAITTPTVRSSCMSAQGASTELLVALCKDIGADTYLSGAGGAKYQDEEAFRAAGIKVIYSNYKHRHYDQQPGEFVEGLSAVDLLFNHGPHSGAVLRGGYSA